MLENLLQTNPAAAIVLTLAVILFAGFAFTRLTKRLHLPNVTGYILAGVLLGPYVLGIVPAEMVTRMDFVTDVALSFIAFDVGRYFKLAALKKSGAQVLIVTVFESLIAGVVITLTMIFLFHLSIPFSLLLGAIGCATAPASTIMTIKQYKAKGEFVNMILQVVALDDAVALIAFSICAALAQNMEGGSLDWSVLILPVIFNLVAIAMGSLSGFILNIFISDRRSNYHRLVLVTGFILGLSGLCMLLGVSPLLTCMAMGMVYVNVSHSKKLFKQVGGFTPPILLMFFVLSGLRLNVPSLATAGVIGVVYFFVRIFGKYLGAWLGAKIGRSSDDIRKYLGLALVPQAGVSIGLAVLGQRMLPPDMGTMLSTIILSSGVMYEMVGPACAKLSLHLSHSIPEGETPLEGGAPAPASPWAQRRAARLQKRAQRAEAARLRAEEKAAALRLKAQLQWEAAHLGEEPLPLANTPETPLVPLPPAGKEKEKKKAKGKTPAHA